MMEISLLTLEDANKLPQMVLMSDKSWWLKTPGYIPEEKRVAFVMGGIGDVYKRGMPMNNTSGVRPIIYMDKTDLDSLERNKEKYILYGTDSNGNPYEWIDISRFIHKPGILLKNTTPEEMIFDSRSVSFKESAIKEYLDIFMDLILHNVRYADLELQNLEWIDENVLNFEIVATDELIHLGDKIRRGNGNFDMASDISNEVWYNFYLDLDIEKEDIKIWFSCNNGEKDDYDQYEIDIPEGAKKIMLWKALRQYVKDVEE